MARLPFRLTHSARVFSTLSYTNDFTCTWSRNLTFFSHLPKLGKRYRPDPLHGVLYSVMAKSSAPLDVKNCFQDLLLIDDGIVIFFPHNPNWEIIHGLMMCSRSLFVLIKRVP